MHGPESEELQALLRESRRFAVRALNMRLAWWWLAVATVAAAQAPGQLTPDVKCAADPSQSYALYVPSNYTPDRTWPVILAFDPGARGRVPVERYQAAAEQYGYIVAGSNTSRNGPWAASEAAIRAMSQDVGQRFPIDDRRMYLAGMSGGARFAMGIALGSPSIAGVIASSAGFPDSKARKSVGFAVFGTAGTEDFNYVEMRKVDRELTTPHRLRVFQGGHVWLPPEVATEAVEWLEVQAAQSGRAPKDQAKLDRIFAKRTAAAQGSDASSYTALQEIVRDFEGIEDVRPFAARAAELGRDKKMREAIRKERD
jgi:poly(3-hydroxybutyrate) depolymerase